VIGVAKPQGTAAVICSEKEISCGFGAGTYDATHLSTTVRGFVGARFMRLSQNYDPNCDRAMIGVPGSDWVAPTCDVVATQVKPTSLIMARSGLGS